MLKFKDLSVSFSSEEEAMNGLREIEEKCSSDVFLFDEEIEKQYAPNKKVAHIKLNCREFPEALILLFVSDNKIKVINVIPYNNSVDSIDKNTYNNIVDYFYQIIIRPLFEGKNKIELTSAEVAIDKLIPKSFPYLNNWSHCPGAPNNPFDHPNDLGMWFRFICELKLNNETLSSGDLEQWLAEELQWEEEVVTDAVIRYETEIALLVYFENYKRR